MTRLLDDACIFLNRPGFPAGAGCAFHIAAARRGVNLLTLKPEVCWQLPLRREDQVDDDEGHVTSVIRQWDRRHWGKGGREFHWWCTEAPEAFVGTKPVYEEMQAELTEMVGSKVYDRFVALVRERERLRHQRCAAPPSGRAARRTQRDSARGRGRRRLTRDLAGGLAPAALVVQRVLFGLGRRGHGAEDAVVLVLFGQAPRGVHVVGLSPALGAPSRGFGRRPLQAARSLRSADGVPFSRELLVTPGPHLGVPPPRPDRTGPVGRLSV